MRSDSYHSNNQELESAIIYHKMNPINGANNNSKPGGTFASVRQKVTGVPQTKQRFIQHFPSPEQPAFHPHNAPVVRKSTIPHSEIQQGQFFTRNAIHQRSHSQMNHVHSSPQPGRVQFSNNLIRSSSQQTGVRSVS